MIRYTNLSILAVLLICSASLVGAQTPGKWKPDWENLKRHQVPEWILNAKLGIQYVGAPRNFDDTQSFHWTRSAQRYRKFGSIGPDPDVQAFLSKFHIIGGLPYVWVQKPEPHLDDVIERYKATGARFLVSMLWGAYPGTEGLWMVPDEVRAARRQGMKVGLHYNLLRRDGIPSIGDAGYVEWFHRRLQRAVEEIGSNFVFFDGDQAPSAYFKTAEFLAWYYNWAERNGEQVWVNDDLGMDRHETGEFGDLVDLEGGTTSDISPKPWVYWDTLQNEWTCWESEYGVWHKRTGRKWVWRYRPVDKLLQVFLDTVSKGGGWIVQMVNTKEAWARMHEIGVWLKVNGEAIYGTRPYGEPDSKFSKIRQPVPTGVQKWWWRFNEMARIAAENGPLYFTRKGTVVYAIHWGWPGEQVKIPNMRARPGSAIRMLGVDEDLQWRQEGRDLVIQTPNSRPCKYAYAFRIEQ